MHDLHRMTLSPRTRARLTAAVGVTAVFATGVVSAIALRPAKAPVIQVAAPKTHTTMLPFAVPSVIVLPSPTPPAPPPPADEPALAIPPPPRALVPMIDPSCVLGGSCDWDDGFPAISADGALIAIKHIPDDGGRGYPGMSIELLDAKTARRVKTYLILSPDEYVEGDQQTPRLVAKIQKRATAAQRALDAKQFRSLTKIGDELDINDAPDDVVDLTSALRAERVGDAVRLIDNAAGTVIFQRRFPVEAEYPQANHDWETDGCYPSTTRTVSLAWDATTRTVLSTASYASGPCYCGDTIKFYTSRL